MANCTVPQFQMWVTGIEVSGQPLTDYREDRGWDASAPIAVNSKIFFPLSGTTVGTGETLFVGGAAYGGTRVTGVEVTSDSGVTWRNADIVRSIDADYVWVFWETWLLTTSPGNPVINARATGIAVWCNRKMIRTPMTVATGGPMSALRW